MKAKEQSIPAFLAGGGEMGALIRAFDWSTTVIGSPDTWPQSLRIAVRIMLDCPFGMYIAWGKEYIQMYNDGYRPILGATKHPQALGISTPESFSEIWPTIGPMFEGVMQGTPVRLTDFVVDLNRNGFLEECVFDFSYSPIRLENGEIGGVLTTVVETTEKVKAVKGLKESESRFQNLIRDANVGIIVLTGEEMRVEVVNEAYGRLIELKPVDLMGKRLFDVIPDAKDFFHPLLNNVRLTGESLYLYDQPYSVVTNGNLVEGYLNVVYQPYKETNGNIAGVIALCQDITETTKSRKQIEEGELRFRRIMEQSPVATTLLKGPEFIIEIANEKALELWGKTSEQVINLPVLKAMPELQTQGFEKILKDVFISGQPFIANELPVTLIRYGKSETIFINFIYEPLRNNDGAIEGIVGIGIDVTEQVNARKQIEASEAKFKMLSESIPHMVWTATPDGNKNFFNKYFLEYTGLSFESLKDNGWEKIIFPEDLERELTLWHQTLKTGEEFKNEKRVRRHDGTYRWHLSHSIPQKNEAGEIIGWFGTNTDITEQKSFAEALEVKVKERTYQLHIQNETFKQAEESSLQGSYSFNLTTGKLAYSDNLYRLIGYDPHEFEPSLAEFNKHVHPDDRDFVQKEAEKVLQNKTADEWHYRMYTKTGTTIHIKGTGRVIRSGDEKLLVGTLQDVTKEFELNRELQEKEVYRKQIINNAPDAVIVINEKNIITLWNPKTEEIFGWKAEEVLGLQLTDVIVPTQYRQAHREGMKRLQETGEARILNKTLELTALNKAGKEFPISITISQATLQGNVLFIAFLRDITLDIHNKQELIFKTKQLEEMNQSLELKNKELENSNTELASFSYVASHDLQEPLRKIQTFGKRILETEKLSNKTQDYFNRIISAGERMQNLIVSLIDFSRTNVSALIFEPCDLNIIVEESLSDLALTIHGKQATIEYENLPIIKGLHLQLAQLFTNLIDNAVKYSRPEIKPHIKITASQVYGKDTDHPAANIQQEYYAIKIADNGIGFEKQYETKIFEVFQRLHGKNDYSGTGIGLAIVKKIVTNHNGFIIATGKPGIGSTFTLYIPKA